MVCISFVNVLLAQKKWTVSKNGKANFTTVQAALFSIQSILGTWLPFKK